MWGGVWDVVPVLVGAFTIFLLGMAAGAWLG